MSSQEREQLFRRVLRAALGLDLETRIIRGELQLPDSTAPLGAPPERDASDRERSAGHVVVDRREDPPCERPTA